MTQSDGSTKCENCLTIINVGDTCSADTEGGLYFCVECSSTWEDFLNSPDHYYRYVHGETVYFTPETAREAYEKHVSDGGKITDRFGLMQY